MMLMPSPWTLDNDGEKPVKPAEPVEDGYRILLQKIFVY